MFSRHPWFYKGRALGIGPKPARHAYINCVRVRWVDDHLRDAFRSFQPHVGPGIAAVGGLVNTVADRNRVPRPGFTGPDPNRFWIFWIDRNGADGLRRFFVKNWFICRAAICRFPYASGCSADIDREAFPSWIASMAAIRPLIVAEPMLRAPSPEIVSEFILTAEVSRQPTPPQTKRCPRK